MKHINRYNNIEEANSGTNFSPNVSAISNYIIYTNAGNNTEIEFSDNNVITGNEKENLCILFKFSGDAPGTRNIEGFNESDGIIQDTYTCEAPMVAAWLCAVSLTLLTETNKSLKAIIHITDTENNSTEDIEFLNINDNTAKSDYIGISSFFSDTQLTISLINQLTSKIERVINVSFYTSETTHAIPTIDGVVDRNSNWE